MIPFAILAADSIGISDQGNLQPENTKKRNKDHFYYKRDKIQKIQMNQSV